MSITAIPVPSEPKPVPNRWVGVTDHEDTYSDMSYWMTTEAYATPADATGDRVYLLPGTALADALAELERASEELEVVMGTEDESLALSRWEIARRNVKALTPKGTNP